MNEYLLEIATFTLEGVFNAAKSGADRIELCENPHDGGTTPSCGMLKKVMEITSIPVFPIIRPRGGNFVYSDSEYQVMEEDIIFCKELGYEGVVFGILNAKGDVDTARVSHLVSIASPMQVTFHRAFDRCSNPRQALEDIIQCGCKRILTSGQFPSVMNGLQLIKELIELANDRIIIMPGSGLNSSNVNEIVTYTQAKEFHTAARKRVHSETLFSPSSMDEHLSYITVDEDEVKKIKDVLKSL